MMKALANGTLFLVAAAACPLLGACTSGEGGSGDGTFECSAWYRRDVTVAIEQEAHLSAVIGAEQAATLGDFRFTVLYTSDDFEGRSLLTRIEDGSGSEPHAIERRLFQLGDDSPQNEFVGGHGFTGLSYVYHPTSGAELQYMCQAE